VATIIQDKQRGNEDRHQRWTRIERADLFAQYGDLHAQGVSQRQAAKVLDVPRSTLQAWRMYARPPRCLSYGRDLFSQHARSRFLAPLGHRVTCGVCRDWRVRDSPGVSGVGVDGTQSICGGVVWNPAASQPPR